MENLLPEQIAKNYLHMAYKRVKNIVPIYLRYSKRRKLHLKKVKDIFKTNNSRWL